MHKQGSYIWNQKLNSNNKLEEGVKIEIPISLPNGLLIEEIYKLNVIDQTNKSWVVKWSSYGKLLNIATEIDILKIDKETGNRIVNIAGYKLGTK